MGRHSLSHVNSRRRAGSKTGDRARGQAKRVREARVNDGRLITAVLDEQLTVRPVLCFHIPSGLEVCGTHQSVGVCDETTREAESITKGLPDYHNYQGRLPLPLTGLLAIAFHFKVELVQRGYYGPVARPPIRPFGRAIREP